MEKINCNVIQDILPLYIDDVVSDDAKELARLKKENRDLKDAVEISKKAMSIVSRQ